MRARRRRHLGKAVVVGVAALVAAALVGAPASAAPTKYYTATADQMYEAGSPPAYTPAVITLTNVTRNQTLGSAEVDLPSVSDAGVDFTWSFDQNDPNSCVVTRASGSTSTCAANGWTVTQPVPDAVRVETASNTKSALATGDSVTLTIGLSTGAQEFDGSIPVGTTAKQSNTFNDNKDGNLFTLQNGPFQLSVAPLDPSQGQICSPDQNPCTLTSGDGQLDTVSTLSDQPSAVLLALDGTGSCGKEARPGVDVTVFSTSAKTVDLTWTKEFTQLETNNGASLWPVCMQAPYAFYAQGPGGKLVLVQPGADPAVLATCTVLAAAGKTGPCVSQLKKVGAGQQFAEILVPGNSQDPKFF